MTQLLVPKSSYVCKKWGGGGGCGSQQAPLDLAVAKICCESTSNKWQIPFIDHCDHIFKHPV